MTKRLSIATDAVLVAIDMSKHRQEVLIERPEVNVVVRSHVHTFAETGRNFGPRRHGVVTPAWQLKTAFGSRVTRQRVTQVGGIIYELQAGEFNFRPILYDVPKRNPM